MRSEVQVLLDPPFALLMADREGSPSLARPRTCGRPGIDPPESAQACLWGLSSVGRAPALQAGCHRFESVRLHHLPRHDQREPGAVLSRPVGRGSLGNLLTSFREINQRCRSHPREDAMVARPTAALSKSSTLTNVPSLEGAGIVCMRCGSKGCGKQKARGEGPSLSSSGSNQAR